MLYAKTQNISFGGDGIIIENMGKNRILQMPLRLGRGLHKFIGGLRTLRWKLFLSYLLISILPMFILWNSIVSVLENHLLNQRAVELRSQSTTVATMLGTAGYMEEPAIRLFQNNIMRELGEIQQAWIVVVDTMATVRFDSLTTEQGNTWATQGVIQALSGNHHSFIADDRATLLEIAPIRDGEGDVVGAVMMTHHVTDLGALIDAVNSLTMNFIALLVLVVAIVVILAAQWLIKPMGHILSSAKKISEGQLDERIDLRGKDEFASLGIAINDMTDKLAKVETARQEFVSNVSHELKTPLSSIKVLSESLLHQGDVENEMHREFLSDITSEVDRMTNIVNELLSLVRLDEVEMPLNISPFGLNKLMEDVIKRLKPLAEQKQIAIDFAELKQVNIEADEMKLSLAISNLVENAIKYNRPGGNVKIILDADNKSAFVTIADDGLGISEENQSRIFDRFFRVSKGRDRETGGTGLGLAITHKTILLHKGSIKLTSKEEDGSTFIVRVPLHVKA